MFQHFRSSKVLFSLLLFSFAYAQWTVNGAEQKIATVDLAAVFDGYWRTQAFRETLKGRDQVTMQEMEKSIAKYNKELESVRNMQQEFNNATQNKDQQEKLKPKLQQQLADLKIQEEDVNLQLKQARERISLQQEKARSQVMEEIRAAINQKAKASGFDYVFDTSGNTVNSAPSLLFHNGKNDITQAVLTVLNANAPAPESASSITNKSTNSTELKGSNSPAKKN